MLCSLTACLFQYGDNAALAKALSIIPFLSLFHVNFEILTTSNISNTVSLSLFREVRLVSGPFKICHLHGQGNESGIKPLTHIMRGLEK